MKIRKVIYGMMIIMGAIAEIYKLKLNANPLSEYFGLGAISYGSFGIVIDYFKGKNKNEQGVQ